MNPLKILSLLLVVFSMALPLAAQDDSGDGGRPGINGYWEVVTSRGRFVARIDQIASVSQHEYIIDGAAKVYECTVDTDGGQTARFYYIEAVAESLTTTTGAATINRLKELASQTSEKVGLGAIDDIVTKHYPDTTHAKTSEYRMKNKETIGQIYDHVRKVWAEEKGRGGQNMLVIKEG